MAKKRGDDGLFTQIGDEQRKVRSLRLTDTTWNTLGQIAEEKEATRADLVEELAATYYMASSDTQPGNTRGLEQELEDLREDKELLKDAICTVNALQPEPIPVDKTGQQLAELQQQLEAVTTERDQLKQALATVNALQSEDAAASVNLLQSEPAILLNQLKGKHPKSKASLKDVEAILGMLGG